MKMEGEDGNGSFSNVGRGERKKKHWYEVIKKGI